MAPEPHTLRDFQLGPFILDACLCERVLEEKDGVKSAIRMLDQINRTSYGPNPPAVMAPFQMPVWMLVRMKAGAARGNIQITVRVRKPSQDLPDPLIMSTVNFPGPEDAGIDLVGNLIIQFDEAGTWWFDLYLDAVKMVRIPLRVVYLPQTIRTPHALPGGAL